MTQTHWTLVEGCLLALGIISPILHYPVVSLGNTVLLPLAWTLPQEYDTSFMGTPRVVILTLPG